MANSALSNPNAWNTLTHNVATVTVINESFSTDIISNSDVLKTCNEILIKFTEDRIAKLHLIDEGIAISSYLVSNDYKMCVRVKWVKSTGTLSMGCSANTWTLSTIPVKINANTIKYR